MAFTAIHNLKPRGEVQAGEKRSSEESIKYSYYFFDPAKIFKALIRFRKLDVGFTFLLQLIWLKTLGVAEENEIDGKCEPKGWF